MENLYLRSKHFLNFERIFTMNVPQEPTKRRWEEISPSSQMTLCFCFAFMSCWKACDLKQNSMWWLKSETEKRKKNISWWKQNRLKQFLLKYLIQWLWTFVWSPWLMKGNACKNECEYFELRSGIYKREISNRLISMPKIVK